MRLPTNNSRTWTNILAVMTELQFKGHAENDNISETVQDRHTVATDH